MGYKFNPFSGNFDLAGSGGGGTSVLDGEVQFFSDLPQTVGTPPVNSAYLVRESEGTIWFGNKKQKGIYIRSGNSGVRNDDWTYGGEYPVTSVNGQVGDITLTPADLDAAEANHSHQPNEVYADAANVSDTTLSSGEPNGIYYRDGSDNGKGLYKSAEGYSIWWDDGEEEWVLGSLSQAQKYYLGAGDTTYPWQATSWVLGPQGSGDTPIVDQALLSNVQRNAARDLVSTRAPKTGNASSTQVVLGNDTRLTNSRTPTAHAASHASTGSDPLFDQDLNTTDDVTFNTITINGIVANNGIAGSGFPLNGEIRVVDTGSSNYADFVAYDNLTANRRYDLPDASGTLALTSDIPGSGGTKTYAVFTAEHNQPPSTAFATLDTRNSIAVLDFDDATDESAVFVSIIPEGASLGSGLKIRLHWMATSATSGNCVWDVSLERMTTDLDSDSFDTIASGTAAANGTSGILTVTEITLTTIDSVTAGDGYRLKVTRDANNASDTMSNDAELVAVEVRSAA